MLWQELVWWFETFRDTILYGGKYFFSAPYAAAVYQTFCWVCKLVLVWLTPQSVKSHIFTQRFADRIRLDFRALQVGGLESNSASLLLSHSRSVMSCRQTTTTDVNSGGLVILCPFQQILLFHVARKFFSWLPLSLPVSPGWEWQYKGKSAWVSRLCVVLRMCYVRPAFNIKTANSGLLTYSWFLEGKLSGIYCSRKRNSTASNKVNGLYGCVLVWS